MNSGNAAASKKAAWTHYHKIQDEIGKTIHTLFYFADNEYDRRTYHHKWNRLELLRSVVEKLLSPKNINSIRSISIEIGLSEGILAAALNHPNYYLSKDSEKKIIGYLYGYKKKNDPAAAVIHPGASTKHSGHQQDLVNL